MSEEYKEGGEQGYVGDGPNLRYDDFVERIVRDPNEPPDVLLLSGYLGSSSEEGHVRLYLDEELCRYVEIPEKAIRHTQELPPEQSALGGSLVWLDRNAEVVHGPVGSDRRKATFLEGQIAQDYIGGAGGIGTGGGGGVQAEINPTQSIVCGGGILPTDMGPGCESRYNVCITRTELPGCRTLTGIFCTRFGPGCHRTIFEANCHTVLVQQCQHSVFSPCFTQNKFECQVSGFVPCNPPIDFTIYEQGGVQQQFAAPRAGGGFGFEDPTFGVFQTGFNCPSVFDNCATRESFCPTQSFSCPSRLVICQSQVSGCFTRSQIECPMLTRDFRCITVVRCPTQDLRCRASAVAICTDTRAGCQVGSLACGVDLPGGGQQIAPNIAPAPGGIGGLGGGAVAIRPTLICPSQALVCQSQFIHCRTRNIIQCYPTFFVICNPTPFCPTQSPGCGASLTVPCHTQFGSCETIGACPSAVDACPSRFGCETQAGCFESQVCGVSQACGVSQGCFPGGGVGGGGGAQAFAVQPTPPQPIGGVGIRPTLACVSQLVRCPSAVDACPTRFNCPSAIDACPTRFNCPSVYTPCQSQLVRCPSQLDACPTRFNCPSLNVPCQTRFGQCETFGACPSAVDACPSRFGCEFESRACSSQACNPGGGFDPGGGFGGGF